MCSGSWSWICWDSLPSTVTLNTILSYLNSFLDDAAGLDLTTKMFVLYFWGHYLLMCWVSTKEFLIIFAMLQTESVWVSVNTTVELWCECVAFNTGLNQLEECANDQLTWWECGKPKNIRKAFKPVREQAVECVTWCWDQLLDSCWTCQELQEPTAWFSQWASFSCGLDPAGGSGREKVN